MGFFGKSKDGKDELSSEERAARREQRRAERNRKKKGGDDADEPETKKSDKQVGSTRSRKEESVLRETVFETAVSTMKANKLFRVRRDDEDLYVGAMMKFEDIGGLSKKDMKDESKGQIITLINNGGIASIFTMDLKSKDRIVFIPSAATLEQMAEFSLLADDLEYELVLVNPYDETIESTDVFVDLDYLQKCHANKLDISAKLAKVLEPALLPGDEGYSAVNVQPETPQDAASAAASTFDLEYGGEPDGTGDEIPGEEDAFPGADEGSPEDYGSEFEDYDSEFGPDEGEPDGEAADGAVEDDGSDGAGGSDGGQEPVYVGAETSSLALARKFFNDDMARELNTSALEQAIAGIGQFRPLLLRPEDTWLAQQLNVMIDLANKELFAAHQKNLDVVRNAYLNALGSAYIEIMSKVQDYESDERYAPIAEKVKESEAGIEAIVQAERDKLSAEWEEKVHNAGEVARINTEQTYRERYGYQFEERMRNIDAEVRAGLQAAENRAISDLKAARRREAQVRLDQLDSQEIAKAVDMYQELLSGETALYEKHEAGILKFLDENRQSEIARVNVLDSELKRDERIAQIQAEYSSRAEALQVDFDTRVAGLQADIEALRKRHAIDLEDKDKAYRDLQAKYNADREDWKGQIKDLTDEIVRANDSKAREVKTRVAEMQAERDSYSQKYDHLVRTQKSTSMLLIALAVVGALAALMVGIVIGGKMGSGRPVTPDSPPVVSDTVLPADGTGPDSGSESGGSGQEGESGTSQGETQEPGTGEEVPSGTPVDDPAWAAMQDPVI